MLRERAFLVGLLLSGELLAQNVVVNPAGSQSIVQPAGTTFSTNTLSNINYVTAADNWNLAPTSPASIVVGANTITLTTCPRGLSVLPYNGTITYYAFVYLATTGTPEAAQITSTTCPTGGGGSGTITLTAANTHSAGYTVASASQGIQEAIFAAPYVTNASTAKESGSVIIPPTSSSYVARARITVPTAPNLTLDFSGSLVTCTMADTCLFVGNSSQQTFAWDMTIRNFTGQAGCNNCNFPMIEDAAQKTNLIGIGTANPNPVGSVTSGSSFGSLIQIDNDQAAVIDRFSAYSARWSHCDTTFCSVAIKGAGGSGNAGIIYLSHANMNLGCGANGVDNQNSNTMRISDSVIQAQAQFAIRSTSTYSNVPNVELDNVYGEVAGCANMNPLQVGTAGLIVENGFASVKNSTGPTGAAQLYANTGSTQYNYYVVAHSSTAGVSAPFLAGVALTNGSGSITVKWPQFGNTGTVTYDVIRTSGLANSPAPYTAICTGGSTTTCGSIAAGLTTGAACSTVGTAHICSFTDTASTNTTNYTVVSPPTYWPAFGDGSGAGVFWPGAVIYTFAGDSVGVGPSPSGVHFDRLGDNVSNSASASNGVNQLVNAYGALQPQFFSQSCVGVNGGAWISCVENVTGNPPVGGATLLQAGAYNAPDTPNQKGRLIFEQGLYGAIAGGHKITLVDSNPAKTLASPALRPGYDSNDTYIGLDNSAATSTSNAQLAFGAPVSISNYIGNVGDNTSFLERLTASFKMFNVPLQLGSTINKYNNLPTAGTGVAPNLGTPFNSGSLTANQSAQTIYTTAASGAGSTGNYRVCITLWPTVTGTATAIQGAAIAPSGSGTVTLPVGPALSTATLNHGGGGCSAMHVAASSAIQCSTTGYSGTGTYKMSCTVEQLQ